jgi:hypothetical protein
MATDDGMAMGTGTDMANKTLYPYIMIVTEMKFRSLTLWGLSQVTC